MKKDGYNDHDYGKGNAGRDNMNSNNNVTYNSCNNYKVITTALLM